MSFVVREIRKGDRGDAARLAAMFSTWDSVWPGGFTRGVALTPEWAMQEMERRRSLYAFAAEMDDLFVGFCAVQAQPNQTDLAYVDLLGASPDHHGKGVGKSLLLETVRRVTDDGYRQLTLHTWAGNMKAVPLYKKTGFHWVPDTSVLMRNFIPTILAMPAGRAFFANRDWYACQERDLSVAPDDITWKGMKVYPYRFQDGDAYLHCIFDSSSERMTSLETAEYSASCSIPIEEGAAGETYPIVWEFAPHNGKNLEITLLAEAEPGLELNVQEQFVLDKHTSLTRSLKISPDARPRREGEDSHRVRSLLLINGTPVTLETGVKVVHPIEIDYRGQGLLCGRKENITVRLHSRLDREITAALALDPLPNSTCTPSSQQIALPPRGWTECSLQLTTFSPGVYPATVRCVADEMQVRREIAFRSFAGSAPMANVEAADNERAMLESPGLSIELGLRGGRLRLTPAGMSDFLIGQPIGEIGPPFSENRQRQLCYEVRAEQTPQAALIQTAPSQDFPGLTVERVITMIADSVVRIDYRVINTTEKPLPAKLRLRHHLNLSGHLVYPNGSGVMREPLVGWGVFPETEHDVLAQGASLPESWFGFEDENQVCGAIWSEGAEAECGHGLRLTFDLAEIPPYGHKTLSPMYLVAGAGNWETLRGWWRRLIQPTEVIERSKPEIHRVVEIISEPSPALVNHKDQLLHLELRNDREKPLSGTLELTSEPFLTEPISLPVDSINRDKSFTAALPVTLPVSPGAGVVKCRLSSVPMPQTLSLPVVYAGGDGTIETSLDERGQVVIDNGFFAFRAAPQFAGALTALERNGVNHLFSGYPESRPFHFTNPWFGGIHAILNWPGDARLTKEKYTGGPAERTGARGWQWQGAAVSCDLEHKDLNWLRLETEYLTLPGSNLLAILTRWINRTSASHTVWGGIAAWCQPGGSRENSIARWQIAGQQYRRHRGGYAMQARSDRLASIENSETGDVIAMMAPGSEQRAMIDDFGSEGAHLHCAGTIKVQPGENHETLHWLVLADTTADLDGYAALEKAMSLP